MSLAAIGIFFYNRHSDRDFGKLPDIVDLAKVMMSPSVGLPKVYLQNAHPSDQSRKNHQNTIIVANIAANITSAKTKEKTGQSSQSQPASKPHDDLKSSLRQLLHAKIDHWLDENMANLVEDALQATPQSRTKPIDETE